MSRLQIPDDPADLSDYENAGPDDREQLEALNPKNVDKTNSNLLSPPKEYFIMETTEGTTTRANPFLNSDDPELNKCGMGCFKPEWIQRFATKRAFMLVFSILAVIQGMSWAYFTATITTLEKRFKISSQTAGRPQGLQRVTANHYFQFIT